MRPRTLCGREHCADGHSCGFSNDAAALVFGRALNHFAVLGNGREAMIVLLPISSDGIES